MAPWWLRTQSDEQLEDELSQEELSGDESTGEDTPKEEPPSVDGGDRDEDDSQVEGRRRRRRRRRRKSSSASDGETGAAGETAATEQRGDAVQQDDTATRADPATAVPKDDAATPELVTSPAVPSALASRVATATPAATATLSPEGPLGHNFVVSFPERSSPAEERKLALFCDFENIALGVRSSEVKKLDIDVILARLLEKGKIIVKRAYADWERYNEYKRELHEAAIELIDIPQKYYSGKNSADIKLVVDAMDLCYSKEHLDTFVILSGDSDFSPLVSKLKENDKLVIGVGMKDSSSKLLVDNCDEFVFYEDLWRAAQTRPKLDDLPPQKAEVFGLMADAMLALLRENKEILWGSLVKQTMQRKRPSFNEGYYGYGSFSQLLEDAEKHRVIGLRKDERSGNYVVTGFISS